MMPETSRRAFGMKSGSSLSRERLGTQSLHPERNGRHMAAVVQGNNAVLVEVHALYGCDAWRAYADVGELYGVHCRIVLLTDERARARYGVRKTIK